MSKSLGWLALGAAVALVLWIMAADHSQSMERCQAVASFDTCFSTLNP